MTTTAKTTETTETTVPNAPETTMRFVTCEGSKQDWKETDGVFSCPTCEQTSRDLKVNLKVSDGKPVPPKVPNHKVEKEVPVTAKAAKSGEKTASDYRREVDAALIKAAGNLVPEIVPEQFRAEVAQMISNQLHHLSTPAIGWESALPKPDRAGWK